MMTSPLEAFAADRDAANSSWLADRWLRDYLTVRTPLQTTSNVGFQINLRTETSGLDRAVDILRALALVHLKQADGSMPEEVDGRRAAADSRLTALRRSPWGRRAAVLVPAVLMLCLGLVGLDRHSVWRDEAASLVAGVLPDKVKALLNKKAAQPRGEG